MNFRIRMKSAMLLIIMLCVLCVNSVLSDEGREIKVKENQKADKIVCYTTEDFNKKMILEKE